MTLVGFVSRRLTPQIARDADLVLTMAKPHRAAVLTSAPTMLNRTFTLREAVRLQSLSDAVTVPELVAARARFPTSDPEAVVDPIGCDEQTFRNVGTDIATLLLPFLTRMRD